MNTCLIKRLYQKKVFAKLYVHVRGARFKEGTIYVRLNPKGSYRDGRTKSSTYGK